MKKETDIRCGRRSVFLMHIHLVFVTKCRHQIFDHDATEKLRTYFSNVCTDFEADLVEMDGKQNHIHLLINYPPRLAILGLVNSFKGVLWHPSYFASSCGGAPISIIHHPSSIIHHPSSVIRHPSSVIRHPSIH
ncbi:IS200/IS605 family transposase [Shigella sonnei]